MLWSGPMVVTGKPRDSLTAPICDHFARVSLTIFAFLQSHVSCIGIGEVKYKLESAITYVPRVQVLVMLNISYKVPLEKIAQCYIIVQAMSFRGNGAVPPDGTSLKFLIRCFQSGCLPSFVSYLLNFISENSSLAESGNQFY